MSPARQTPSGARANREARARSRRRPFGGPPNASGLARLRCRAIWTLEECLPPLRFARSSGGTELGLWTTPNRTFFRAPRAVSGAFLVLAAHASARLPLPEFRHMRPAARERPCIHKAKPFEWFRAVSPPLPRCFGAKTRPANAAMARQLPQDNRLTEGRRGPLPGRPAPRS